MRRRARPLTPEDRALWQTYAGDIRPLVDVKQRAAPVMPTPAIPSVKSPRAPHPAKLPTPNLPLAKRVPRTHIDLSPDPMEYLVDGPLRMDAKAHKRLKRGKVAPDARIDLHGMTAERAHGALRGFILNAAARDHRLVLVITGKGREPDPHMGPARRGVLRNAVPQWLAQAPLGQLILQVLPAHDRHGGGGAYYVYLKRQR